MQTWQNKGSINAQMRRKQVKRRTAFGWVPSCNHGDKESRTSCRESIAPCRLSMKVQTPRDPLTLQASREVLKEQYALAVLENAHSNIVHTQRTPLGNNENNISIRSVNAMRAQGRGRRTGE